MKTRSTTTVVMLLALFAFTSSPTVTAATALYFDAGGTEKPWDYLTPNWSLISGSSYNQTWTDGSDAYFEGTGGTVNVSSTINSINSLTFDADGYTLSGGTIALTGNYGNITTSGGTATIGSVLTGSKGVTKLGDGTLVLTGLNNYSGNTIIQSGTLRLAGGDNRLPENTHLKIGSGAGLDLNDSNLTVGGFSGSDTTNTGNISLSTGTLTFQGSNGGTFFGSINGEGNLVFSNAGVSFRGQNTYTGTTTINATSSVYMPVYFHSSEALPGYNSTGKVTINDGGVLAVGVGEPDTWEAGEISTLLSNATFNPGSYLGIYSNGGGSYTHGESISGQQGLVTSGNVTLSAANTFSGDTRALGDVLSLANSHALQNSTIKEGGMGITFSGITSATIGGLSGYSSTFALTNTDSVGVALTVGNNDQSTTYMGNLSGKGSLTKTGSGTFTLTAPSTYEGSTTVNEGILQLYGNGNLPETTDVILANVPGAGIDIVSSYDRTFHSLNGGGELGGNVSVNTDRLYINSGNYAGVICGGADVYFGHVTLSGSNSYTGNTAIGGNLSLTGGDDRLPTDTTIYFAGYYPMLNLNGNNQTVASLEGTSTYYSPEIRLGNGTLTINGDEDSHYYGFLSGSGNLVKEGTGMLYFDDNPEDNTHSGSIIVNEGTFIVDGHISENASITLADAADVEVRFQRNQTIESLNGGGANGGTVGLSSGNLTVHSGNFAGNFSDGGYLTKEGAGTLTLSGNNGGCYTVVNNGTLDLAGEQPSSRHTVIVNNGELRLSGTIGASGEARSSIEMSGGTTIASGTVYLNETTVSAGTFRCENPQLVECGKFHLADAADAALDLNGGSMTIGALSGGGFSGGNVHLGSGTLTLSGADATYAGIISGEGGNLIVGGGMFQEQTLTGANTYTGTTTIDCGGKLILTGGDNRLPIGTALIIANDDRSVLDMTDQKQTIASLSDGVTGEYATFGSKIRLGIYGVLTVGDENDTTYSGRFMRSSYSEYCGTLIKQGCGTLTLAGDNYLWQTIINEGSIKITGSIFEPCGLNALTLANAAGASLIVEGLGCIDTLEGGGSEGGSIVISNGGTLHIGKGNFAGAISGNGDLVVYSSPYVDYTMRLSGANTYQGSTTIYNNATLILDGGDNRLPTSTALIFDVGGTLDLNGYTQTVASLSTATPFGAHYVNLSSGTLIVGDDNDTEFLGQITGEGTLIKQGSGTLLLEYIDNASITVNEGCLMLDAAPFSSFNLQSVEMANVSGSAMFLTSGSDAYVASLNGGGENGGNIEIESMSSNLYVSEGNFDGSITGGGYLKKQGSGTFVLSGSCSTYMLVIEDGILQLDGDNRIAFDTPVDVSGAYLFPAGTITTGELDLNGFNQSCRSLGSSAGNDIRLGGGALSVGCGHIRGTIEGEGNLVKLDSGTSYNTLTLYDDNTYTGTTTALSGLLDVTGSLLNNGSDKILLAANDTVFDATITRSVGIDASYVGFGSTAIGAEALGTSADLIGGINTETGKSLSMQWRLRDGDELAAGLASDVLNLSGMADEEGEATDLFTLQMTYSTDALPGGAAVETLLADAGKIELVWFNDTESLWQNAALGNFGSENDVQFMGVDYTPDGILGHWGIDVSTHTVWAVLDHNSQFAVAVPEPGTIAMLAAALLLLAVVGYRRAF